MAIDYYSPRVMIAALRERKAPRTFLRDLFFSAVRTYRTENIDLDQQTKVQRVAPFVHRYGPAKPVDREGFTTSSVTPPCLAMKMAITVEDVSTRVMGENIYADLDPAARARQILADDLSTMDDMRIRREEIMCRDVIFDSAVTCTGEDYSATFTFTRNSALTIGTLTGSNAWTHADSDPILQFDTWSETYARISGFAPTDVIMGSTAYQSFVDNTKVKAKMDLLRMDLGSIRPTEVPMGARLVGQLFGGALRLWTYSEYYADPDNSGTLTPMIPATEVVMGTSQQRTERRYGAVQDLTETGPNGVPTLRQVAVLPRSWVTMDPPVRFLEVRSRPLPVPIQNYFLTVTVQ